MKFLSYILLALIFLPACLETDDAFIHDVGISSGVGDEVLGSHRLLVYLNFNGGELFDGDCGNPQKNISCINHTEGDFAPHDSDDEYRSDVVELLRSLWIDYDVAFTRLRPPAHYDYVMIVISPQQSFNDYIMVKDGYVVGGVAPLDCHNKRLSDTAHVFTGKKVRNVLDMAEVISHETGHTLGLGHVTDQESMMYGLRTKQDREWKDICVIEIEYPCASLSPIWCPPGFINHHRELLQIVGPSYQ